MRIDTTKGLEELFDLQGRARWRLATRPAAERRERLRALRAAMVATKDDLAAALQADYRKPEAEAWLTEYFPSLEELDFALAHLDRWMRDRPAPGMAILPLARSWLRREAKGRVLILSPWNYPYQLLIGPLIAAVAAGNTVIAKPSNKTPATSAYLARLLEGVFPTEEVAVVEGPGAVLGEALLALPFDHVFFTGSPSVGAHVGEMAQRVHAGLTLELGGKSPAIILADADLDRAAERLAWGKHLNAGQTCIAPDYLLCPRSLVDAFAQRFRARVEATYGPDEEARRRSPDLARLVDRPACLRQEGLVRDALASGANLVYGGVFDPEERYAAPTLLTGVRPDMALMAEEIFGPILPVLAYDDLEEALAHIQKGPKPLALYVFGRKRVDEVLAATTSGSACVNDVLLQIENLHLPFGGVGMSGMGSYHGEWGFRTFSHERNVMRQGPVSLARPFYPPYGGRGQRRLRALLGWLKRLG